MILGQLLEETPSILLPFKASHYQHDNVLILGGGTITANFRKQLG